MTEVAPTSETRHVLVTGEGLVLREANVLNADPEALEALPPPDAEAA